MRLIKLIAVVAIACTPVPACAPVYEPAKHVHRGEPEGTEAQCQAMCETLEGLPGGCGMLPESMPCPLSCVRQNSVIDDYGEPIATLNLPCITAATTCQEVDQCPDPD